MRSRGRVPRSHLLGIHRDLLCSDVCLGTEWLSPHPACCTSGVLPACLKAITASQPLPSSWGSLLRNSGPGMEGPSSGHNSVEASGTHSAEGVSVTMRRVQVAVGVRTVSRREEADVTAAGWGPEEEEEEPRHDGQHLPSLPPCSHSPGQCRPPPRQWCLFQAE